MLFLWIMWMFPIWWIPGIHEKTLLGCKKVLSHDSSISDSNMAYLRCLNTMKIYIFIYRYIYIKARRDRAQKIRWKKLNARAMTTGSFSAALVQCTYEAVHWLFQPFWESMVILFCFTKVNAWIFITIPQNFLECQ